MGIEPTPEDTEPVEEGEPADAGLASEAGPEPAPDDTEPAQEDAEPVEEGEPADEGLAQEAGHEPAPEDAEPARGDAESVHAEAPEPAAKDTEAAPAAEDPFPAIDDQGPVGEGSSQPAENSPDSKEAPEFSCLDDLLPHNGIPLVIIRINEDDGNSAIDEMNGSRDHSVKCTGTVEIRFPDGYSVGEVYFGTMTEEMALEYIRGRRNSTWGAPKKPYKIKFDSKQDLLDMGKSKEWALMANSMDPTAMKNRITYELGEMMGIGESPQLVPVEVVMIGSQTEAEYLGLYDLSETIKFEKSRLDLKTPDEDATQEEGSGNITGAYMISIYNWLQDGNDPSSNHFTTNTMNGLLRFMFREPEYASEDLTEAQKAQREYMQTYIRDLEALIMADDYIDEEQHRLIADRMDLTSTADYWWIQIFTKNTDSYATSSTNMYKPADDKLYWGPLWDFDMGWTFKVEGEEFDPKDAAGYWTIGFSWIDQLRKTDPYFVKLLKDRWGEMQPKLGALTADSGIIDQFKTEIAGAQTDDYRKWSYAAAGNSDYKGVSDYDAVIERLKQFIDARVVWFNENLETVGSFLTVSMDAAGGTGVMADIITVKKGGEFELPACEFAPESGSEFVGWKIGDELYQEGDVVTLSKDTVLMAVWKVKAPDDDPANDPSGDLSGNPSGNPSGDPSGDPSGNPEEIAIPDPVKPVSVEFVVYKRKPDPKTADDPSDIPADAGRSGGSSADAGRSGRSSADIGRSGGSNARVYAGNGEFRSPDSGDGAEPLLWIMIMAVMGMAICVVNRESKEVS